MIQTLSTEGKIVIVSSHLLENLERNCNKWALIHNGHFYENTRLQQEKKIMEAQV